jgi:hypothetical protein
MNMKRLMMTMFVIAIGAGLYAQNNFFPSRAGITLTYADNDAGGNVQGYSVLTIKDVKGSGRNMTIAYGLKALDKNRKPLSNAPGEINYQVVIKDNVAVLDLNRMIPAQMKEQGVKADVKGTPIELPNNLQPGQSLKPSEATITIDLGIMKMITVIKSEGKCLAIEDVRVPAGTFKCHKVTQKYTSTAMNVTTVETTVSWYAPNIGTVKSETYDDKNKLVSSSVLVEVKGN